MKISDEARDIFLDCINEHNKYGIVFSYIKDLGEISMLLCDKDEYSEYVLVNGIPFIFLNGADIATKNWTIIEENNKLTIKKECMCCTDESCEYVCNRVRCGSKD